MRCYSSIGMLLFRSSPQNSGSRKYTAITISRLDINVTIKPTRIISVIRSFSVAKMMALGGVLTGIMNAQLAAMAHGIISASGWIFRATASAATTGRIMVAVAVLDVISVRN